MIIPSSKTRLATKLSRWFNGNDLAGGLVTHGSFEVTHCPEIPQGTEELLVTVSSYNPERFRLLPVTVLLCGSEEVLVNKNVS